MLQRDLFLVLFAVSLVFGCQGKLSTSITPSNVADSSNDATPDSRSDVGVDSSDAINSDVDPDVLTCDDSYVGPTIFQAAQKNKTLINGEPITSAEYTQLENDPSALRNMIRGWLDTPTATAKLRDFFDNAFQQTGFDPITLAEMYQENSLPFRFGRIAGDSDVLVGPLFYDNVAESFPRTVFQLMDEGAHFKDSVTTKRFMMTPAMMVFLAQHDERIMEDEVDGAVPISYRNGTITQLTYQNIDPGYDHTDMTSVDAYGLTDPTSPNFMRFFVNTQTFMPTDPNCQSFTRTSDEFDVGRFAFRTFVGSFERVAVPGPCRNNSGGTAEVEGFLTPEDFTTWKMVEVRPPENAEMPDQFYELTKFRDPATTELVLHTPRVGFLTTQAFFALWATNADNQARVTANQTLIVALSESMEDVESATPLFDDALDDAHASPGTACFGCHKALDPMRQYFRNAYTYGYAPQTDPTEIAKTPSFLWRGVQFDGGDIYDLAETLSDHPLFAVGWMQKLCFYANSKPCPADDPTFIQLADDFRTNGSFKDAAADLMASPLVTGMTCIEGGTGDEVSIARQRHFCALLENRLNKDGRFTGRDMCRYFTVDNVSPLLPDDAFSRGDHNPITVSEPSLVVRAAYEKVCEGVALRAVRGAAAPYPPNDRDGSILNMVVDFMGVPPEDPKHADIIIILTTHYEDRILAGDNPQASMESVFTAACMSPSVMAIGF